MKTQARRKEGTTGGRSDAPAASAHGAGNNAIRDGSGQWSAGLANAAHAALVGRIAGLMPQIDELMADLAARLLGDASGPGRAIFRGLAGDGQRVRLLRALAETTPSTAEIDAAIASYAAARRRWRAYLHGLWYTHGNGRTFLAAPGSGEAATFLVAREVKAAELEAELARLTALGATLPRLGRRTARPPPKAAVNRRPTERTEPGKAGRAAPKREVGTRRRRAPRWGVPSASASAPEGDAAPQRETGERG